MADPSDSGTPVLFEALQPGSGGAYAVKLPVFEGPLDLLLHLIRLNEVDVTDIPIARVAQQYLEYLEVLRELDLDVAGEYLLMAATLAWIKSRMLLPPEPGEDDDEGLDPRAELVARLLEYQRFKEAAGELAELPRLGRDVFRPSLPGVEPIPDEERTVSVGLFELLTAMRSVLDQSRARSATHEVEVEEVTVLERMRAVMDALDHAETLEFLDLFREPGGEVAGRARVVATFLAILELARLGALRIYQGAGPTGAPEGPIRLRRVPGELAEDWAQRISELM
jgi:segregation and condensation protein A